MMATGVCHSDLSILNGTIPSAFPVVLGHEGAGVVEEVGDGVSHVRPGDQRRALLHPPVRRVLPLRPRRALSVLGGPQRRQPARRHDPGPPQRRGRPGDVVPRQHGRTGGRARHLRRPHRQGHSLPGRRPCRMRGHYRRRGGHQDGGGASGLHGGGGRLRGSRPFRHPGLPHRWREADHRGRPLGREDGDGKDVRRDRHDHPRRARASRDHGNDRRSRGGLRVRGDRAPRDHRDLRQGRAPGRNRGPGRGGTGGGTVLGELAHPSAHLQDHPRVHVRKRQLQGGLPDVPRPVSARTARPRRHGDPHLRTRRGAAGVRGPRAGG